MAKREFTMLAHVYKKQSLGGFYASEKLDGVRAIWDGGISRGIPASEVPYANTTKDARYVTPPVATGLWTRYAKPIQAPDWWLDQLPPIAMDGELWIGRNAFQKTTSIASKLDSDEWDLVSYMVFNLPYYKYWLANGRIYNNVMDITLKGARDWAIARAEELGIRTLVNAQNFRNCQKILHQYPENAVFKLVKQVDLGMCRVAAKRSAYKLFDQAIDQGGEGLILVDRDCFWMPERSHHMLKLKGSNDAEAEVIGYTFGRKTEKDSKLLGVMGAMHVSWDGKEFLLSGFTQDERELVSSDPAHNAFDYACAHPAEKVPSWIEAVHFPIGSKVTFRYRELTDDGLPKEARYFRKKEVDL